MNRISTTFHTRHSRRSLTRAALMLPFVTGFARAAQPVAAIDIEPFRTPLYRLLEITPARPGPGDDAFPVTSIAAIADPRWGNATLGQTSILPEWHAHADQAEAFFGFPPSEIASYLVQDDANGWLAMIQGTFGFDRIEDITAIWRDNGYISSGDTREPFIPWVLAANSDTTAGRYPDLTGISDGRFTALGFLDNQTLVIASKPEFAVDTLRASHRQVELMLYEPGVTAIHRHEPAGLFEAVILPGNHFPVPAAMATPVASDGVIDHLLAVMASKTWGHPFPDGSRSSEEPDRRSTWSIVVSVGRVGLDDADSGERYASIVQEQFASAISRTVATSFPDIMSLDRVDVTFSTVVLTFTPLTDDPHDIIHFALSNDLDFLIPVM